MIQNLTIVKYIVSCLSEDSFMCLVAESLLLGDVEELSDQLIIA